MYLGLKKIKSHQVHWSTISLPPTLGFIANLPWLIRRYVISALDATS